MKYGELKYCEKCSSDKLELVKYPIKDGRVFFRYQCKQCGYVETNNVKGTSIPSGLEIPFFDKELRDLYIERVQERSRQFDARQAEQREQFFEELKEYYNSTEWHEKRNQRLKWNKILNNGFCERCNKYMAEHVHHKNYKILNGLEHPFDLEALCSKCHKMLHPHMDNDGAF